MLRCQEHLCHTYGLNLSCPDFEVRRLTSCDRPIMEIFEGHGPYTMKAVKSLLEVNKSLAYAKYNEALLFGKPTESVKSSGKRRRCLRLGTQGRQRKLCKEPISYPHSLFVHWAHRSGESHTTRIGVAQ